MREKIYNIPAGIPFAKTLAASLLQTAQDSPEHLSETRIFLPTRRACRVLQDAFLTLNHGQSLLLPKLQPIGDIDEEELALSSPYGALTLALDPPMPPLKRQILLARLIQEKPDAPDSFDQALTLAKALGHFMDQIYTENLDMKDLKTLVPESFAHHWQITLKFLEILSEAWPAILKEHGAIDAADRRNQLILALNKHWQNTPPQTPVIAAGTTGSIPATAALLKTISTLPQGRIILPGLDPHTDKDSWAAMEETHPQFGFKNLLQHLNADYRAIKDLPAVQKTALNTNRNTLAREAMRPGETAQNWASLTAKTRDEIEQSFENLALHTAQNEQEEAEIIALLMRQILEDPGKTACLITPDRLLAKRVQTALQRWDINIDDSAGYPLSQTSLAQYLLLLAKACEQNFAPLDLLALLKHSYVKHPAASALDIALRGTKPGPGLDGLKTHIENRKRLQDSLKGEALNALNALEQKLTPLAKAFENTKTADFTALLKTHLKTAQIFTNQPDLWHGENGEQISAFLANLLEHAVNIPKLHPHEYCQTLQGFMDAATLRPSYGQHPRLQILGQLEARLIDADLVILGGLNEGTWPPDPGADPWMSRPMRKEFGLPSSERSIGLSAHDFVQGLCAPNVALTRATKKEGAPTVPARWLQRLEAVMEGIELDKERYLYERNIRHWVTQIDEAQSFTPAERPQPKPPAHARPTRLSVTKIETWLKDPYAIYAAEILKLKKLDDLEHPIDAAVKGNILHDILEEFVKTYPAALPENTEDLLYDLAQKYIQARSENPALWALWLARFKKIAAWFADHENQWRKTATPLETESYGEWQIGALTLSGIADRIDESPDGAVIIDYKSGGNFTKSGLENAEYPQLPLEALMLKNAAFETSKPLKAAMLQYWVMNGNNKGGTITSANISDSDMPDILETDLKTLIKIFADDNTPYISLPRADKVPRFNDYLHLARVQEWSVLSENDSEAA